MKSYFIKFYNKYIIKNKMQIGIITVLFLFSTVTSLITPILIRDIIDKALINRNIIILKKYSLILSSVLLLNHLSSFFSNIMTSKYSEMTIFNIRMDLFKHLQNISLNYHKNNSASYVSNRIINDTSIIKQILIDSFLSLISSTIKLILGLFMTFSIDRTIGLIYIIIVIINYLNYKYFTPKIKCIFKDLQECTAHFNSGIQQSLYLINIIRSNSWETKERIQLLKKFRKYFSTFKQHLFLNSKYTILNNLFGSLGLLVLIYIGGNKVIIGSITLGDFVALNTFLMYVTEPLITILTIISSFNISLVSLERIKELFEIPREINGIGRINDIEKIDVSNVTFSYDSNQHVKIFDNFNCSFKKGNVYCIIGKNGSGKSTLKNLIVGNYYSQEGTILFNKIPIEKLNRKSLHKHISIVDQEPILFRDKIINNIILDQPLDNIKLDKICKICKIDDFVKNLENGLETLIDEKNMSISGGQKQRIVIARTLYKNSSVIILDEPTSALDKESVAVLNSIILHLKKSKIIILISHDKRIINICDKVIDIDVEKQNNILSSYI
ncbi:ABC transporter ATP-binding protein [Alkaliphilus sp. B6464]|uniref:ABC transporter ATP-binding protein n=1 Tax=Alkaliphilus sp. B6464 TaxID=2731219 RepID=UPI001BAADCBE|nr:ABC transporter ATP-binding protein [Alkaliphilus sp. B6464]QUH18785.1 ABC transporter ATP-binding protein [Alkaliphilus sp. B6464]